MRRRRGAASVAGSACGGCPPLLTVSRRALMPRRARYSAEPAAAVGHPFAGCATTAYATAPRPAAGGAGIGLTLTVSGRPTAVNVSSMADRRQSAPAGCRRAAAACRGPTGLPHQSSSEMTFTLPGPVAATADAEAVPVRPMQSNSFVAGGVCGAETSLQPAGRSESCRFIRARSGAAAVAGGGAGEGAASPQRVIGLAAGRYRRQGRLELSAGMLARTRFSD